jgi:hypothetical protein
MQEVYAALGILNEETYRAIAINGGYVEMAEQVRSAIDSEASSMTKLSTNSQNVNAVMGELTSKMLFNAAAANLDGAAALELAKSMGLVNQDTYGAMKALDEIQAKFDTNKNGIIENTEATNEYIAAVTNLDEASRKLQDQHITITVDTIQNTIETRSSGYSGGNGTQTARAAGGPVYPGMTISDWRTTSGQTETLIQQPGYVLTEAEAKDALAGARGGGVNITQNIYTPLDMAEATAEIAEIMRRER